MTLPLLKKPVYLLVRDKVIDIHDQRVERDNLHLRPVVVAGVRRGGGVLLPCFQDEGVARQQHDRKGEEGGDRSGLNR